MGGLKGNKSFWTLTGAQFLGAFNDSAFRQFILLLALSQAVREEVQSSYSWLGEDLQPIALGLFSLPFVIFALLGGAMADRYSKRSVIVSMKWAEVLIMVLGVFAFALWLVNPALSLFVAMGILVLMGTQSAFFGPSKYGSIPELVEERELTRANGVISMTTWISIILGMSLAGQLNTYRVEYDLDAYLVALVFVAIAVVGLQFSRKIRMLPAADPRRGLPFNIAKIPLHAVHEMRYLAKDRELLLAVLGSSWFSFVGALVMPILNNYGQESLGMVTQGGSDLMWPIAVGIGVGSLLASRLSRSQIEFGIVPFGALGMSVGLSALYFLEPTYWGACVALFVAGSFGGIFIVPLTAFIQHRPAKDQKGRILGANELVGFTFIFMSAGVYHVLRNVMGLSPQGLMMATGLLMLVGSFTIFSFTPQFLIRSFLFVLTHSVYRIRSLNLERLPSRGGALLVSNHVSFVDPFLIGSATPRLVRFLMHRGFLKVPVIGWFGRLMKAIPVAPEDGPRTMLESLESAGDHVKNGHLVCIFAEGGITRTGNLLPFSKGLEKISRTAQAPIVPVYIDRMWGSIFSFRGGKFFFKLPERFPYAVTVAYGEPMPHDTPAYRVREAVEQLGAEAFEARKRRGETLGTRFFKVAHRYAFRKATYDHTRQRLSFFKFLVATLLVRRLLKKRVASQEHIGVLLPPSNGGAIANVATALLDRVAVNLNFTIGKEAYDSAIEQCEIRTIVTSKRFVEKVKLEEDERHLDLEELLQSATLGDKIAAFTMALMPTWLAIRLMGLGRDPDARATVIFSSGSTGLPKGVCLSHHNILSNVRSLSQVFDPRKEDGLVGVLPLFHSFGYTAACWLPLLTGMRALYHPSPIDAKGVVKLIREQRGTLFFSTPTFFQSYLRRFEHDDFKTVRLAVSGAEKLKAPLAAEWRQKFGFDILEGYGCTELSPAVALNVPDVQRPGVRQVGHKRGTIGHPLPGVAARVVNPDTFEPLKPYEEGLLLIKGPNVMLGYLGRPDLTDEVIKDGWYITGDIARIDTDGFITITDRLSRFSKIGGEMVPHVKVEEAVLGAIGELTHTRRSDDDEYSEVAVTSLPDDKKGERLVVLHTKLDLEVEDIISNLRESELPNLWIPRKDSFVEVEEIPKLGTGKLDLTLIKKMAEESATA